jgi:hypothetical protein
MAPEQRQSVGMQLLSTEIVHETSLCGETSKYVNV